jgi:hypothetical protein
MRQEAGRRVLRGGERLAQDQTRFRLAQVDELLRALADVMLEKSERL